MKLYAQVTSFTHRFFNIFHPQVLLLFINLEKSSIPTYCKRVRLEKSFQFPPIARELIVRRKSKKRLFRNEAKTVDNFKAHSTNLLLKNFTLIPPKIINEVFKVSKKTLIIPKTTISGRFMKIKFF